MSKHTDSFETLDPQDWEQSKALMHQMVDDAFDYTKNVRERKIWQEMPDNVLEQLQQCFNHVVNYTFPKS